MKLPQSLRNGLGQLEPLRPGVDYPVRFISDVVPPSGSMTQLENLVFVILGKMPSVNSRFLQDGGKVAEIRLYFGSIHAIIEVEMENLHEHSS
jgi:hypothetical protein